MLPKKKRLGEVVGDNGNNIDKSFASKKAK